MSGTLARYHLQALRSLKLLAVQTWDPHSSSDLLCDNSGCPWRRRPFACISGALIIGWILLPVAFILGIVALTRKGKKTFGILTIVLSIVGGVLALTSCATERPRPT